VRRGTSTLRSFFGKREPVAANYSFKRTADVGLR